MSNIIPFPSAVPTIEARFTDGEYWFYPQRPHGDGECIAKVSIGQTAPFCEILKGRGWNVVVLNEGDFDE